MAQQFKKHLCLLFMAIILPPTISVNNDVDININIVSLTMMDPNLAMGLPWTGPAIKLAAEQINSYYNGASPHRPRMHVDITDIPGLFPESCAGALAQGHPLLADYYYRHLMDRQNSTRQCNVLLTSSCVDFTQASFLTREWNWLILDNGIFSTVGWPGLPNVLTLAGTIENNAYGLMNILKTYKWYHVTIILATKVITIFYPLTRAAMETYASQSAYKQFRLTTQIISGEDEGEMMSALLKGQKISRIFIMLTSVKSALKIMNVASRLPNFGNGEYVFITLQPLQNAQYGTKDAFNNPTPEMLNLTRSLIFMSEQVDRHASPSINQQLKDSSLKLYNASYHTGEQPLENYAVRGSLNGIHLAATLIAEAIMANKSDICGGAALGVQARNRAFTFPVTNESIRFDTGGMYVMDTDMWAYDAQIQQMAYYQTYQIATNSVVKNGNFSMGWPSGAQPSDIPACGFFGTEGPCAPNTSLLSIILPIIAGALVIVAATILWMRRYHKLSDYWWLLDPTLCQHLDDTIIANPVEWNNKQVWIKRLAMTMRPDLNMLRRLIVYVEHPNINRFYGLYINEPQKLLVIVSDYCKRDTIITLMQTVSLDQEFRLSLVRNLIKGVAYLHQTVRPHGNLQPKCCLIDSRFTLKIGYFMYDKIISSVSTQLTKPYIATDINEQDPAKTDVYAVGEIMVLILQPETIDYFVTNQAHTNTRPLKQSAADLLSLINMCHATIPQQRPKMQQVLAKFNEIMYRAGYSESSIVENILQKYTIYADTLSDAVQVKTLELLEERKKSDMMLHEIFPHHIVESLRNRHSTQAEYFDHVTVFFSDLYGFDQWVPTVSLDTMTLTLNTVYGLFDTEISNFTVYKVETIKDSYMVVGGIPKKDNLNHAVEICQMAITFMTKFNLANFPQFRLRCGIHSGPCAAGVIGTRAPRYCLFGDTVNMASRMNSHGESGRIHISPSTHELIALQPNLSYEQRGIINIKGKGEVQTFWLAI